MLKFSQKTRKCISAVLILVTLFLILVVVPMIPETISSNLMISGYTESSPKLIAHRGLSSLYPENTTSAFYGAAKYGFDAFELDIHTTKDGEWVVIHDDDVDHMTDGTGKVDSFTLEEILELNIDNGNHIEEEGIKGLSLRIPTLRQTLDICKEWNIFPVIEIKNCDITLLSTLKDLLDEYELSDKAIIISFDEEYLEAYRSLDKDAEILYLANEPTKEDIDWCIENNFGINFNMWLLYKCFGAVRYAKENDVTLAAWTVDNTFFADIMVLLGIEYITTNKILP